MTSLLTEITLVLLQDVVEEDDEDSVACPQSSHVIMLSVRAHQTSIFSPSLSVASSLCVSLALPLFALSPLLCGN